MSEKKNILVTGCTSGVGLEVSRYLYKQGYQVLMTGRNKEKLKSISKEIGDSPYVVCDLSDTAQITEIFEYCRSMGMKLNGLVHCAGVGTDAPIRVCRTELMNEEMQVHYFAFVEMCKQFYSRKVSEDGSSIVAISSISTQTRRKGSVSYSASKGALNTAVLIASKEFLKRLIRVNAVLPAYIDTRMIATLGELADLSKVQPMGLIPPKAIAEVVEFLISEKSRYITGALIPITAGMEV